MTYTLCIQYVVSLIFEKYVLIFNEIKLTVKYIIIWDEQYCYVKFKANVI